MRIDNRRAFLAFAALLPVALTGCNTVEGVGQDVENLGDNIEDAAERRKRRND